MEKLLADNHYITFHFLETLLLQKIYTYTYFLFISGLPLNSYISYFEPVYFDSSLIKSQLESGRVKRSVGDTNTIILDFKAQNR